MVKNDRDYKPKVIEDFVREITFNNRNPSGSKTKVIEMLNDKSTNYYKMIPTSQILYRSRIVKNGDKIGEKKHEGFFGFDEKGSTAPPPECTFDQRANYRYIPYLYCAENKYVSVIECRPRVGSKVSIAKIKVINELKLLDFTLSGTVEGNITSEKKELFEELSVLYSKPCAIEDDTKDYIPTQYIAEFAKNLGYDGIAYKSSLAKELEELKESADDVEKKFGYNIVIFDFKKNTKPIGSNVFKIKSLNIECKKEDDDERELEVQSPLSYALSKV